MPFTAPSFYSLFIICKATFCLSAILYYFYNINSTLNIIYTRSRLTVFMLFYGFYHSNGNWSSIIICFLGLIFK